MTVRKEFDQAVAAHQRAAGHLEQARAAARTPTGDILPDRQRRLITQLAQAGTVVTPGWLGQALSRAAADTALGHASSDAALSVRIGECVADENCRFRAVVNVLGTGHVVIDADAADARVLSIVQAIPLRLLAARPAEALSVSFVDTAPSGGVFSAYRPLIEAGLAGEPATDAEGVSRVLGDAEAQIAKARRTSAGLEDLPERLIVVAGLRGVAGEFDERIRALTTAGLAARVHMVLAGWRGSGLDNATHIEVTDSRVRLAGVPLPVTVDPAPDPALITQLCTRLAAAGQWLIGDGLA